MYNGSTKSIRKHTLCPASMKWSETDELSENKVHIVCQLSGSLAAGVINKVFLSFSVSETENE